LPSARRRLSPAWAAWRAGWSLSDRLAQWPLVAWLNRRPALRTVLFGLVALFALDLLLPPDMSRYRDLSLSVTDSAGQPLRTYLARDGMLRMPVAVPRVNRTYLDLLLAYEDRRFRNHPGVDPLALARALGQAIRAGQVVSGGSTLTMQVARLLEPRPRTPGAKLIEMLRALQLERRYSKDEILGFYLTLAPFGGNLEGVRTASLAYFGREPAQLTLPQAALLVALPQAPTRLRRDMSGRQARAARNKVLHLAGPRIGLGAAEIGNAMAEPLRLVARPLRFSAPHLADRLRRETGNLPPDGRIASTLDGRLQGALENRARGWEGRLDPQASLGLLVVDTATRTVRVYLGSTRFRAAARAGQVDATTAVRSPGSTLKPFLYALAFDRGLAHPATLVDDVETRFGHYTPVNFREAYHGRVTLAEALRQSMNVPAVLLMDRLGPVFTYERLQRAGLGLRLPAGVQPGLPVALGGVGTTLENLVGGYAALASDGVVRSLRYSPTSPLRPAGDGAPLTGELARDWVGAILRTAPRPDGVPIIGAAQTGAIAVKTGTSYGFRDAWALGYDGRHTVGVWTGRPDGTPSPGRFGVETAAPILFEVFDLLGVRTPGPLADLLPTAPLPPAKAVLARGTDINAAAGQRRLAIRFPVDGAVIALDGNRPIPLEAAGGQRPYTWLVNGAPAGRSGTGGAVMWTPDGPGFQDVSVIDAGGAAARVRVRLTRTVLLLR